MEGFGTDAVIYLKVGVCPQTRAGGGHRTLPEPPVCPPGAVHGLGGAAARVQQVCVAALPGQPGGRGLVRPQHRAQEHLHLPRPLSPPAPARTPRPHPRGVPKCPTAGFGVPVLRAPWAVWTWGCPGIPTLVALRDGAGGGLGQPLLPPPSPSPPNLPPTPGGAPIPARDWFFPSRTSSTSLPRSPDGVGDQAWAPSPCPCSRPLLHY